MMDCLNHISTQRGTSYYNGVPKSYLHTVRDKLLWSSLIISPHREGQAIMMEFLSHISTQRGTSYYDGVPKSYLHTERDKLL
jgi:hypothetical protein